MFAFARHGCGCRCRALVVKTHRTRAVHRSQRRWLWRKYASYRGWCIRRRGVQRRSSQVRSGKVVLVARCRGQLWRHQIKHVGRTLVVATHPCKAHLVAARVGKSEPNQAKPNQSAQSRTEPQTKRSKMGKYRSQRGEERRAESGEWKAESGERKAQRQDRLSRIDHLGRVCAWLSGETSTTDRLMASACGAHCAF